MATHAQAVQAAARSSALLFANISLLIEFQFDHMQLECYFRLQSGFESVERRTDAHTRTQMANLRAFVHF